MSIGQGQSPDASRASLLRLSRIRRRPHEVQARPMLVACGASALLAMIFVMLVADTNWAEVTGIATGALAVLTTVLGVAAIWAALLAKRALSTAAEDLEASRDATRAAQANADRQMRMEQQPLLIDVAPGSAVSDVLLPPTRFATGELTQGQPYVQMNFPHGHNVNLDPHRIYVDIASGWAYVGVPLRNVGRGLATIDPDDIRLFGPGLERLAVCDVLRQRVPPGESSRILCTSHYSHVEQPSFPHTLEFLVPYRDFAGDQLTVAYFRIVQRDKDEPWTLSSVRQVLPANFALPSGAGPPLPQK